MSDWPALIRFAALRFSIPPAAFWRLSVREWAALTAASATDGLGRKAFDALMAAHPDGPSTAGRVLGKSLNGTAS